jgi:putative intracellular protease/amidase
MRQGAVHLYVFDGMADWEAAFAVAAINNPQFQKVPGRHRVVTVAAGPQPVTTMGGIRIQPDDTLNGLSPVASSMLILPGGDAWLEGRNSEALEKARNFLAIGVPVAAICAATVAMARAGLLNDRKHTSNAPEMLASPAYHGANHYENEPAVTDKNLITASGVAPVEFAREVLRLLEVYSSATLDAWFALFRNGDVARYYELVRASAA